MQLQRVAKLLVVPLVVLLPVIATGASAAANTISPVRLKMCPWLDEPNASPAQLAAEVTARMTLPQEIDELVLASGWDNDENADAGVPGLCIPPLTLSDGADGIAYTDTSATQLPAELALGATWDTALATEYGEVLGNEARTQGIEAVQAPDLDLVRVPQDGEAFEHFGEDPDLTSVLGVAEIAGIQGTGTLSVAMHLGVYTQETDRSGIDTVVAPRTLEEVYLAPFRAAVEQGHVAGLMCATGSLDGEQQCADPALIDDLRSWGFKGFIRTEEGAPAARFPLDAGIDLVKPGQDETGAGVAAKEALVLAEVRDGVIPAAKITSAVERVLTTMFADRLVQDPESGNPSLPAQSSGDLAVATQIAARSVVLLKNAAHVLPLSRQSTVAVIGSAAASAPVTAGTGSPYVNPTPRVITPLAALRSVLGSRVISPETSGIAAAVVAAKRVRTALVFVGVPEGEGADRTTLALTGAQNALIEAVAAANPRTVVIINSGGAVLMPWLKEVAGVLEAWYPGQQDGEAISEVLSGTVDPSGRLPATFPLTNAKSATASPSAWPGVDRTVTLDNSERNGLEIGYRWYAATKTPVLFPFGYGLSYTTFAISRLELRRANSGYVGQVTLRNTGKVAGAQVVQCYLSFPKHAGEPPLELAAFATATLAAGATRNISFSLPGSAFDIYTNGSFHPAEGLYTLRCGDSSAHLPLSMTIASP